jgi:hypothetical protein
MPAIDSWIGVAVFTVPIFTTKPAPPLVTKHAKMTSVFFVIFVACRASGLRGYDDAGCAQFTIQGIPNRSRVRPKPAAQNGFCNRNWNRNASAQLPLKFK